jgi:hypothetical protein
VIVVAELPLENAVNAAHTLFFPELRAIAGRLFGAARLAVLARDVVTLLNRAIGPITALALEKELDAFPPAQPANGSYVSCHVVFENLYLLT